MRIGEAELGTIEATVISLSATIKPVNSVIETPLICIDRPVAARFLLLLVVSKGSVSHAICVEVMVLTMHLLPWVKVIETVWPDVGDAGKFVPVIVIISPPALFIAAFGEIWVMLPVVTSSS